MEAGLGSGRRGGLPHGSVLLRLILEQLGYQAYLSPSLRLEEDFDLHRIAAKGSSRKPKSSFANPYELEAGLSAVSRPDGPGRRHNM